MRSATRPFLAVLLLFLLAAPIRGQGIPESPLPPAGEQDPGVLAITNAHLHPVGSEPIPDGILLAEEGEIVAVGADVEVPEGARVIDAEGRHVMPGLVDSHSHMGFKQMWRPGTGGNNNELYRSINARTRAQDGVNTDDVAFEVALAAGVTTKNIIPGSRSPNSGQGAIVKLRAPTMDDMQIAHGGMKFAIRVPTRSSTFDGPEEEVRGLLRSRFLDAQEYLEAWEAYENGQAREAPERDLTLEAFGKLLEREWPVGVHAHGEEAITQALRLKEEFDLDLFIQHGGAVASVMDRLLELETPVSFGPVLPGRHRHHSQVDDFVEFVDRGGLLALHQDHPDGPQYYLREAAALFVRQGMDEEDALKTLTLNPARILGVDDRVGSLEEGKDADFLILNGPPLDWESRVESVYIDGREVYALPESDRLLADAREEPAAPGARGGGGEGASAAELDAARDADLAIVGGEIRTISGETLSQGTVLVRDGTIVEVGEDVVVPEGAEVIDASERIVSPGLIDARTSLGPARPSTGRSAAEMDDPPTVSNWIGDGVTAAYAAPSASRSMGGFGGVLRLDGPRDERVVRARAGVHLSLTEGAVGRSSQPTTRQGLLGWYRQELEDALQGGHPELSAALDGEVPLRVAAHYPADLVTALRLAREFDLDLVVELASGAHMVADELAEAGVPVVVGPDMVGHGGGGPFEKFADTPWNAGRLMDAGVTTVFSTDAGGGRSVTLEALVNVGHGVPAEAALRAATLDAARVLGVDDRIGSIEPGKDADLVIWDGEPISTWSSPEVVLIGGTPVLEP